MSQGFAHHPFDGRAFDKLSPCSGRTGIGALFPLEIQRRCAGRPARSKGCKSLTTKK